MNKYQLVGIQPENKDNHSKYNPTTFEFKPTGSKYDDNFTVRIRLHDNAEYYSLTYIGSCFDKECGIVISVDYDDFEADIIESGDRAVDPDKVLKLLERISKCFYNTFN